MSVICIASVPITLIINRGFFRVDYFSGTSGISFFVILVISSNNTFYFYSKWQRSALLTLIKDDYNMRMAYSFRKSFKKIVVTSLTVGFSYYSCFISMIMPIRAVGAFTGTMVFVQSGLLLIFFPPLLVA